MNVYEQIEVFGLVGDHDEFAIPSDDTLQTDAVDMAFDGIVTAFTDSALAADLEPLLWGMVNLYHQRADRMTRDGDQLREVIRDLISQQDGSEIQDVELQDAQREYEQTEERETAFIFMREHAASRYERQTGRAWFPRSGSRAASPVTAAMIDSRDYLAAAKARKTEALAPEGSKIVIAGGQDYNDHAAIFAALDKSRDRVGDMVLIHGGSTKGCDHIAALWAKARSVPQVAFRPNFKADGRSAPFKRNDAMLALKPRGVLIFPGNGISENIGQKAKLARVPVWRPLGDIPPEQVETKSAPNTRKGKQTAAA